MLISVVGSTGLGQVCGVPADRPAALLESVVGHQDRSVLVLAPRYAEHAARRQADLLVAARPGARVRVLASAHHALTLTLVADRVQRSGAVAPAAAEDAVPGLLAQARSLVWSPSIWRLGAPWPGLVARLRSLGAEPGFFLELGSGPYARDARHDWCPSLDQRLHGVRAHDGDATPELLARQLGPIVLHQVGTTIHPGAPYTPRGSRLLTILPPEAARLRPAGSAEQTTSDPAPTHDNESEAA